MHWKHQTASLILSVRFKRETRPILILKRGRVRKQAGRRRVTTNRKLTLVASYAGVGKCGFLKTKLCDKIFF
jgi:hypothetical protein